MDVSGSAWASARYFSEEWIPQCDEDDEVSPRESIEVLDHEFGGDSVAETARNVQAYLAAIPEGMRTW